MGFVSPFGGTKEVDGAGTARRRVLSVGEKEREEELYGFGGAHGPAYGHGHSYSYSSYSRPRTPGKCLPLHLTSFYLS